MPTRVANPAVRRSSTCSSVDSMLACMISDSDAYTSCTAGNGYHCSLPSSTVVEADYGESFCEQNETVIASPEPFDSTIQMTPNLMPEHIPVPKTPRLAESAIPISSICRRVSSSEKSTTGCCHSICRRFRRLASATEFLQPFPDAPAEFQMLPVHTKQGA